MMKFLLTKRMKASVLAGAALGVVCIIGATVRLGSGIGLAYLFALWFNRLLMGMVVGMFHEKPGIPTLVLRGALTGLIVSFAFYSASGFTDAVSFLAGIIYGIVIEFVARRYGDKGSAEIG
jgi:hypothetical protein